MNKKIFTITNKSQVEYFFQKTYWNAFYFFLKSFSYSLCSIDKFPEEPGKRVEQNTKDMMTLGVSIGCGVAGLLILLFLAFWATRIYRVGSIKFFDRFFN